MWVADFEKVEGGKLVLEQHDIDLHHLVDSVFESAARHAAPGSADDTVLLVRLGPVYLLQSDSLPHCSCWFYPVSD